MSFENKTFKALYVEEYEENKFKRSVQERQISDLPAGKVIIRVKYSSLNYKDALSSRGHKGISRKYPHTPGIDAAGIVEYTESDKFTVGEEVICSGYDLGMNTSGGYGQYIRVPEEWVMKLPVGLTMKEAMMIGTAGFTAAICVDEIIKREIMPESGRILVTGATGGVGSHGVSILAKLGYEVVASSGKNDDTEFFDKLGASEVIHRSKVYDETDRPLLSGKWAGAIDTVGGKTLSTVIRSTKQRGAITMMGNVESDKMDLTVYPFILRGVALIGIDAASREMETRNRLWKHLGTDWKPNNLGFSIREVGLSDLSDEIDLMLKGGQKGRIIVNLDI